jgi:hypothetical protein
VGPGLVDGRLERLHRVARRIVDDALPPTHAVDDAASQMRSRAAQIGRDGVDVLDLGPNRFEPPGALSVFRSKPRESLANAGAACMTTSKPRRSV